MMIFSFSDTDLRGVINLLTALTPDALIQNQHGEMNMLEFWKLKQEI